MKAHEMEPRQRRPQSSQSTWKGASDWLFWCSSPDLPGPNHGRTMSAAASSHHKSPVID